MRFFVLCLACFIWSAARAQKEDSVYYKLTLDEFVVKDTRLNLKNFIKKIQTDETFYRAFKNLRRHAYQAENSVTLYDKKKNVRAACQSLTLQHSDGTCRTMEVQKESVTGPFFENKSRKPRFYTAELFDRLFLTHGKVCEGAAAEEDADSMALLKADDKTSSRINELKKLIFRPGERVNVPFIGKKMEIFSEKMQPFYDYSFLSGRYKDSVDCYIFTVRAKPDKGEKETVVKFMETYFDKSGFQVLGRNYRLKYANWIFQFDVTMNIELSKFGKKYIPSFIHYDGYWDIPFKKPEIAVFYSKFRSFQ